MLGVTLILVILNVHIYDTAKRSGRIDSLKQMFLKNNQPKDCYCRFSHDDTKIQTTKLLILLIFYFHDV